MSCSKVNAGVLQYEISDHLPIFGIVDISCLTTKNSTVTQVRKFRTDKQDSFIDLLKVNCANDQITHNPYFDPNIALSNLITCMHKTYHAIFPLEKISRRSRRKYKRPWITAAIIKIIKERNRFFKTYLKNKTASNFELYKKKESGS